MSTSPKNRKSSVRRGRKGQVIGSREVRFPDVTGGWVKRSDDIRGKKVSFTPGGSHTADKSPHVEEFTANWEKSYREQHVVPNPSGGWDVKKPGAPRASSHHNTQAEAEARAKEILRNAGGGEVVIHNRQGRIRDSDTIAPVTDPNPPRDRKH